MRLEQSAQLQWVGQQAQLLPQDGGCASCATPCAVGSSLAEPRQATVLAQQLNISTSNFSDQPGSSEPVAVTVAVEAGALNTYAALVFGFPLVSLFALAAAADSIQISTPGQVPLFLLVVASLLLIVTTLCRSVARRFESQLHIEIRQQKPHKP